MLSENDAWNIIKSHNDQVGLVSHQLDSYNRFVTHGINEILTETGKIRIGDDLEINIYNAYVPRPQVTEDDRRVHALIPSDARARSITYESPVLVSIGERTRDADGVWVEKTTNRVKLCSIPVMLKSAYCHLSTMTKSEKVKAGECEYDPHGYFLVNGNERVVISQIRSVNNIPFVFETPGVKYPFACEIRSMSETTGHSVLVKALFGADERSIMVSLPYVKDVIPVGVIFRSLGYGSYDDIKRFVNLDCPQVDKFIRFITRDGYCGTDKPSTWADMTDDEKSRWEEKASVDAANLFIGSRSTNPTKPSDTSGYGAQVIDTELFPHLGITASNKTKALFIGHMLHRLFATKLGMRDVDDRDDYSNKRVESPGILCYELFKQLFKKYKDTLVSVIDKKKQGKIDVCSFISRNATITSGFRHCFSTGNWGVPKTVYIRAGVCQVLKRLSYGATLTHTRTLTIPIGKEAKNTKIRQINSSQIMFICPCETPEGQAVGIVLNLALTTKISESTATYIVKEIVCNCPELTTPDDADDLTASRVFVNGGLTGFTNSPTALIKRLMDLRRTKHLKYDVSISYSADDDEVHVACDGGRLIRPVLTLDETGKALKWKPEDGLDFNKLVEGDRIRYVDNSEINEAVIAFNPTEVGKYHTDYCEISPALMMGVMGSIIPWPDHSQAPRNCYQTSMGKQAMSMYALSHQIRSDTISYVLGYPQRPLVGTRAAEMMGFNAMPSGINAIVAIACYSGFNQEDSVIISQGAIDRGLFQASSYRTHKDQEKKIGVSGVEKIGCPPLDKRKMDANYGLLGPDGIIMKRMPGVNGKGGAVKVEAGDVLIGKYFIDSGKNREEIVNDCSLIVKNGEDGYVDRVDIMTTPDGYKLVKVVIRKDRTPEVGDKVASRSAQKGTIGMIMRQEDMPFNAEGMQPDIIMNPHAIPSRMTINQLMETVLGKTCSIRGEYGDATPFTASSVNVAQRLCDELQMEKMNGNGTELLTNGMTGECMGEVFMGPVYYQRLKHLVSEKHHARATGPVTTLTRQPLEGRSRDGGLRFGEMERDSMIAHGCSMFLKERLCDQSDPYQAPVCAGCGNISNTKTKCTACESNDVSMVGMPYVSKLIFQELGAMCIKTKISVK